jgi:hypothetical protein
MTILVIGEIMEENWKKGSGKGKALFDFFTDQTSSLKKFKNFQIYSDHLIFFLHLP